MLYEVITLGSWQEIVGQALGRGSVLRHLACSTIGDGDRVLQIGQAAIVV